MSITITTTEKQVTAYDKRITFTREGQEYSVLLHWDAYDGYDLNFLDGRNYADTPEWATDWAEDDSLEYQLDYLSDEMIEASYL